MVCSINVVDPPRAHGVDMPRSEEKRSQQGMHTHSYAHIAAFPCRNLVHGTEDKEQQGRCAAKLNVGRFDLARFVTPHFWLKGSTA